MEDDREQIQTELEHEEKLLEQNYGLSPETAKATAEDTLLGTAPAESSHLAELERIAKAQASEGG